MISFARRAFTLIELLVVMGIIAVLIGILLPVLSAARRTARLTMCAGNLHQLAVGINAYATEYRGLIPRGPSSNNVFGVPWCNMADSQIWIRNTQEYEAHGLLIKGYLED